MRVLIVEDEVRLAEALGQIMAEHRYLADLVYTGPDGLEYGLTNQYDVIVLDVMLPGMDGLAVARGLREAKVSTPILMLTARDEVPDKVAGLDHGADDYMTKPFATEELLHEMRMRGIYLSGSSACEKGARSHVIRAMGIEGPRADSVVRIGLGKKNTREEVTVLVETLNELIKRGK